MVDFEGWAGLAERVTAFFNVFLVLFVPFFFIEAVFFFDVFFFEDVDFFEDFFVGPADLDFVFLTVFFFEEVFRFVFFFGAMISPRWVLSAKNVLRSSRLCKD